VTNDVTTQPISISASFTQGRRHGFRPGWAKICGENSALAHPGFEFAHLDLLKWVGKEFLIHYVLAQSDKINQITQK